MTRNLSLAMSERRTRTTTSRFTETCLSNVLRLRLIEDAAYRDDELAGFVEHNTKAVKVPRKEEVAAKRLAI